MGPRGGASMRRMKRHTLIALVITAAAALPAVAASSASSASSEAGSASVGSLSTSIEGSSNSSSGDRKTAAGEYKLLDVAEAPARPGTLRLTLQAVPGSGADGEFYLYVPRQTVQQHALATGAVIRAEARPYGLQFAAADRAFFLAVHDEWLNELRTTPVAL